MSTPTIIAAHDLFLCAVDASGVVVLSPVTAIVIEGVTIPQSYLTARRGYVRSSAMAKHGWQILHLAEINSVDLAAMDQDVEVSWEIEPKS